MRYYPVYLDIRGKKALVVGGGGVAERKVKGLVMAGAKVEVVSRDLSPGLRDMLDGGYIAYLGREYKEEYLEGAFIVIAATDNHDLNRKLSNDAKNRNLLVNVVDSPEDCNFILPSMVRRGDLVIAISTSGKSPGLSKRIRMKLEEIFPKEWELFVEFMGFLRERILAMGWEQGGNQRIFDSILDSELMEAVLQRDIDRARMILDALLPHEISLDTIYHKLDSLLRS